MKRAALAAVLLLLPACQSGRQPTTAAPAQDGSLAGARWPAAAIHAGMLLHDDGRRLWAYELGGRRRLLWRHAEIGRGWVAAASPEGHELAYVVPAGGHQVLYLLSHDGSVRVVDSVGGGGWLHDAVFLRPPSKPSARPRLYWSRVDSTNGRSVYGVRVLGIHDPAPVHVALREGEYPYKLASYPGSPIFTLALGRHVQPPTPSLLLLQRSGQTRTLSRWGELLPLLDIDNGHGVAWLSPGTFVLFARRHVRLFVNDCVYRGSKVVYSGRGIDGGLVDEGLWPLVPAGGSRVLVMPELPRSLRRDEGSVMRANEQPLHWAVLDVHTGRLSRTRLVFSEQGWVYVQPDRRFRETDGSRACAGFTQPPS